MENKPTAIFAGNDYFAMITISVAKSLGFDVPSDLAVAGFDNIPMGSFFNPRITTVDMPKRNMGVLVFKEMIKKIRGGEINSICLPTALIIRESTM